MNLRKILTSILLILVGTASAEVTSGFYRIRSNSYAGRYITENRSYITLDLSDNSTYYSLGKKNDKIDFYKFDNSTTTSIQLGANKAYLDTSAQASEARGFVFDFDGSSTGIDSMYDGQGTMYDGQGTMNDGQGTMNDGQGTMYDGQGTMYDGQGTMYDLSGRRVDSMKHGIYIINGKKIIK